MDRETKIRTWLGTGAINIFGVPLSGKDTQGRLLAEKLGARLLSSGAIIREMEAKTGQALTGNGELAPTNLFYKWVLPYLERRELWRVPLILSSVGRWSGEETQVMNVAEGAGHPIRAVIYLGLSQEEVRRRWQAVVAAGKREASDTALRMDDTNPAVLQRRIAEFQEKTMPVIEFYRQRDLLITVAGEDSREEVAERILTQLFEFVEKEEGRRAGDLHEEL